MTRSSPAWTAIGTGLFTWRPYVDLATAENGWQAMQLWLALYAGHTARCWLPGLWFGGVGTMAENVTHLGYNGTLSALELLQTRKLVEFDARANVLRLTELPDRCMRADNGSILKAWWKRYSGIPECGVKNRYLDLLRWLHYPLTEMKDATRQAWSLTFGSLSPEQISSPVDKISGLTDSAQRELPKQLDLYASVTSSHGGVHCQGKGKGKGLSDPDPEGESERGGPVEVTSAVSDAEVWPAARARMAQRVDPKSFAMWVEPVTAEVEGNTLRVTAPHEIHRTWFRDHYAKALEAELHALTGRAMQVAI